MGVRGVSPFNGSGTAAPFNGSGTAARPRSSSKSIAPNRESLVFGTNSGSADEPLMRGSFFCGERGGDRSIGEANLRKGAALQWLAHLAPVRGAAPSMAGGTAAPFNGWRPCRPPSIMETALSIQLDGMPCVLCRLCGLAKGRVRPAKGAPVFSFCFMWKKLELWMADDGVSRRDYGIFAIAPYRVVY